MFAERRATREVVGGSLVSPAQASTRPRFEARRPPALQPAMVKRIVCVLLALVGLSLVLSSLRAMHVLGR